MNWHIIMCSESVFVVVGRLAPEVNREESEAREAADRIALLATQEALQEKERFISRIVHGI